MILLSLLPFFKTKFLQGPNRLIDSNDSILLNKDNFSSVPLKAENFIDFSYIGRSIIKDKYSQTAGIYLWFNNINNKS